MLLRRITEHVKAQNWFAVFVDFVIVVVGVFIGIQVSNWNEARVDAISERQYLERLHDEVVTVIQQRANNDRNRQERLDALNSVVDILYGAAEPRSLTALECRAIGSTHIMYTGEEVLPTADELLSAGRLEIIDSPDIRNALIRYRQLIARSNRLIDNMSANAVTLPRRYADLFDRTDVTRTEDEGVRILLECDSEAIIASSNFRIDFADNFNRYEAYIAVGIRDVSDHLRHLHAVIDEELGTDHEAGP